VRNPLLSSYRGGENRVTSSTMAVLERIDLALVQELLGAATGAGSELRGVVFENQVTGDGSVPDARISGRFSWWFETKTSSGAYAHDGHDRRQVRLHSQMLEEPESLLFVLTPDPSRPRWFDALDGVQDSVKARVLWLSFSDLADAMNRLISDPTRPIAEQTRFLLSELVALYEADGLLSTDNTVIVAARQAWAEYQRFAAYICQPNRTFRDGLTHFGFYAGGAIQPLLPRIERHFVAVLFTGEEAQQLRSSGENRTADLIDQLLGEGLRTLGEYYDVLLLSDKNDAETIHLELPIVNDTVTAAGRPWGWTLSQRYTSLDKLRSGVTRTSEL
jgi:hypothetical protein